jgi:hypothetical protein
MVMTDDMWGTGDYQAVAAAQRGIAVQQSALHRRGMSDQGTVVADQGVHAAERVLPVGVGELAAEGVDDHSACTLAGLIVEIGGVDQAGGVNLGVHTVVQPEVVAPVLIAGRFARRC